MLSVRLPFTFFFQARKFCSARAKRPMDALFFREENGNFASIGKTIGLLFLVIKGAQKKMALSRGFEPLLPG
jgi:hypothetical protein